MYQYVLLCLELSLNSHFFFGHIFKSMYEEFTKIKKKNPQLKALLSLGGASAGVEKFRKLVELEEDRFVV